MSDGITLTALDRSLLLPAPVRLARLEDALAQIYAVLAGETDAVALEATLACLLWETLTHANFCGFYRRVGPATLAVGPYQGSMGCLRIDFERGVCGTCARTKTVQRVPDVDAFPGHITCDSRSRSELVIPVVDSEGELRAVLDIDSPHLDAFSQEEAELLEVLVRRVFAPREVTF